MVIRMLDEVLTAGDRGVLLLAENTGISLAPGLCLKDARGRVHIVSSVMAQEDWLSLFIEGGDLSYFERLFRDVRIDATAFEVLEDSSPCL